ncbi:MAG: putative membrane protein, partial [Candidatus Azotimanducaceae bacterium]
KQDWQLLAIASQANVGGQTTAIALCRTFNRPELFLPAILVGSLGNGLGTYLGFLVARLTL